MRWSNVFVIFRREVRDQIRDRRTLFMIFVLPILLYPILGIGVVQFSAAFEQKPRTVLIIGSKDQLAGPFVSRCKLQGASVAPQIAPRGLYLRCFLPFIKFISSILLPL